MSKLLQLRGGTTSEHSSFTGALREVTVDTDKDTLVIHDGSTAGGHALPRTAAEIVALISNDAIDSQHYAAGSIDLEHMSANSVDSDQYVDGSIDLIHMSAESVDSDQYVDGSIDLVHMSANSVDSDQYVDGSIDLVHMSANSVDSDQYVDGSIDLIHMSAESVDEDNLYISNAGANGQYLQKQTGNAGGLTWGTVDLTTLSGANLTSGIIPTARINASSIANDLLDSQHYAAGSIDTEHLAADSVTTAKIADSVALGGSPTTTTQTAADNSTKIATTAYADAAIAALADSAPSTLNTLNELAAALGDDANYATTTATAIGTKMPLAGGAFTGAVTTNSTFDGRDVAADGATADAALPKAGGAMTGAITTNSTFDGRNVSVDGTKLDGIEASATADQTAAQIKTHLENGIDSVHYVDGSIDEAHIGNLQVTGMKLGVDRRNTGAGTDIYSGNANDYTHYDADVGIRWYTANAEDMRLTDAGDLHVDGNITAYSTTISDERLKTDITTLDNAIEKIKQIRGVEFTRIKDGKRSAGVIAQELEVVLPQAITESALPYEADTETLYKTVDYDAIHALLIEAIKAQQVQIETLMDMVGE